MNVWQIADFAKLIPGASRNTVDNWFKNLEENKIHFVNRNEFGEKIYDELDLEIAKYIKIKRDGKWNFPGIYAALPDEFELRTNIVQKEKETGLMSIDELKKEMEKAFAEKIKELEVSLQQTAKETAAAAAQLALPSPEELRQQRFDEMMLHRRIEYRLKKRAEKEWNQLPEEDRTVKTGLFGMRRVENMEKKIAFVAQYVDDNYETELKKELDIE